MKEPPEPLKCLRCASEMEDLGGWNLRTGGAVGILGALFGSANDLAETLLPVHIHRCPRCGKMELFDAER